MWRLLALLCLGMLLGCSPARPAHRAEGARVVVYAFCPNIAVEVAEHADEALAAIENLTGVRATRPCVIWQREERFPDPRVVKATAYYTHGADRVVLGGVALHDHGYRLAHEITHFLAEEPESWLAKLPQFVEQGVATYAGTVWSADVERRRLYARRRLEGLEFDLLDFWSAPRLIGGAPQSLRELEAGEDMQAAGFLIVDALGIDRLRALVESDDFSIQVIVLEIREIMKD